MPATNDNPLGTYLKDRRTKLDPAAFGIELTRRRTPGLRREEGPWGCSLGGRTGTYSPRSDAHKH
jgi:hypothetical protein